MPSLTCFNIRFTPNWLMTLLALVCIAFFIKLGFWQVQRAQEKENLVASESSWAKKAPEAWDSTVKNPSPYQRIQIKGEYLKSTFLLDNQHHHHQWGYDILSPFVLKDGSLVIIDRGWVEGDSQRRVFPHIESPPGVIELQGSAYYPSTKQWVLGPSIEEKNKDLAIIELLDTKLLSHFLQKKVYPFIIRLDKKDNSGFIREWAIVSMPPQRHLAYALQWFVMAGAVFILFITLNLRKK